MLEVWSAKKADSFLINFFVVVDCAFIPPCLRWQPGGAMPASQAELRHWRRGSGCPRSYYLQALYPAQVCSNHPGQDHGSPAEYSSIGGRDNSEQGYSSVRPQPDPASGSGVPIDGLRGLPIRLQSGCQGPSRDHDSLLSVPEKFLGGPGSTHQVARFNNIRAKSSMLHTQQLQGYFFFFLFFFLSYLLFLSFYCLFLFLYSFFILLFLTFLLFLF